MTEYTFRNRPVPYAVADFLLDADPPAGMTKHYVVEYTTHNGVTTKHKARAVFTYTDEDFAILLDYANSLAPGYSSFVGVPCDPTSTPYDPFLNWG